jgi:predicted RNA-binding protein with TRAM domain
MATATATATTTMQIEASDQSQLRQVKNTMYKSETSRRGYGVAKIQGFVIFVKGGRAGQNVNAKVMSVGQRFARAEIVV